MRAANSMVGIPEQTRAGMSDLSSMSGSWIRAVEATKKALI